MSTGNPTPDQNIKTGLHTNTDGTIEHYNHSGILLSKSFKDGSTEFYENGVFSSKTLPNGTIEYYYPNGKIYFREFPDGLIEYYNEDGTFRDRKLPRTKEAPVAPVVVEPAVAEIASASTPTRKERITEKVKERMARRAEEITKLKIELEQLKKELASIQTEIIKTPEPETFSTKFIEETIKNLLASSDETNIENGEEKKVKVKEVKSFEIKGKGNEITSIVKTNTEVKIPVKKDPVNTDVETTITLGSNNGVIIIKNYKINALDVPVLLRRTTNIILEFFAKKEFEKAPEKLKTFIETEKKKKTGKDVEVDKMEIVNGELKVTYK